MSIREVVAAGIGFVIACVTITLGVFLKGVGGYR